MVSIAYASDFKMNAYGRDEVKRRFIDRRVNSNVGSNPLNLRKTSEKKKKVVIDVSEACTAEDRINHVYTKEEATRAVIREKMSGVVRKIGK